MQQQLTPKKVEILSETSEKFEYQITYEIELFGKTRKIEIKDSLPADQKAHFVKVFTPYF